MREVLTRQVADLDQRIAGLVALPGLLPALQRQAGDLPPAAGCYCRVIEHARAMAPA